MSDFDGVEITYSIRRLRDGEPTEVGFGSSGEWDDVTSALHAMSSDVQCRLWETSDGMPDPSWADPRPAEEER